MVAPSHESPIGTTEAVRSADPVSTFRLFDFCSARLLAAGATLNTAGCPVYCRTLTNDGTIPRLGLDVLRLGSGDSDSDGDVDLADFAQMAGCIDGPNSGPLPPDCDTFDFASDGDVDLADFSALQCLVSP